MPALGWSAPGAFPPPLLLPFHPHSGCLHLSHCCCCTSPSHTVMTTPLPGGVQGEDMQQLDNFPAKCAVKRTDGLLEHAAQGTMWQPRALTPRHSRKVLNAIRTVIMSALTIIGPTPGLALWMIHVHWWAVSQRPPPPPRVLLLLSSPSPELQVSSEIFEAHLHKSASVFPWKSMQMLRVSRSKNATAEFRKANEQLPHRDWPTP